MKQIALIVVVVLLAGCAHGGRDRAPAAARSQGAEDQARLAEALAGRVAGTPQDCVSEFETGTQQPYAPDAILFRGRTGDVLYLNRLPTGCPGLTYGKAIAVRTPMSRLCRGDVVTVFDPVSRMETGSCALGPFTPYRLAQTR
jgi:hypothetical protein